MSDLDDAMARLQHPANKRPRLTDGQADAIVRELDRLNSLVFTLSTQRGAALDVAEYEKTERAKTEALLADVRRELEQALRVSRQQEVALDTALHYAGQLDTLTLWAPAAVIRSIAHHGLGTTP